MYREELEGLERELLAIHRYCRSSAIELKRIKDDSSLGDEPDLLLRIIDANRGLRDNFGGLTRHYSAACIDFDRIEPTFKRVQLYAELLAQSGSQECLLNSILTVPEQPVESLVLRSDDVATDASLVETSVPAALPVPKSLPMPLAVDLTLSLPQLTFWQRHGKSILVGIALAIVGIMLTITLLHLFGLAATALLFGKLAWPAAKATAGFLLKHAFVSYVADVVLGTLLSCLVAAIPTALIMGGYKLWQGLRNCCKHEVPYQRLPQNDVDTSIQVGGTYSLLPPVERSLRQETEASFGLEIEYRPSKSIWRNCTQCLPWSTGRTVPVDVALSCPSEPFSAAPQ